MGIVTTPRLHWMVRRRNKGLKASEFDYSTKLSMYFGTAVVTTNAETQVVKPSGLQEVIDKEAAEFPKGRCFIRPFGAEDINRVYAEASSQEAYDALARSVAEHLSNLNVRNARVTYQS